MRRQSSEAAVRGTGAEAKGLGGFALTWPDITNCCPVRGTAQLMQILETLAAVECRAAEDFPQLVADRA